MSSPRAVISVATRIGVRPALKSARARTRWPWLRLPWMAAARALALQLLGQAVGAVLGAGEDEGLVDGARRDQVGQQLALALAVDRMDDLGHEGVPRNCGA